MKHFVKYAGCFMPPEPKKKKKKSVTPCVNMSNYI